MVHIRFVDLSIQQLSSTSGVFSGRNVLCGWTHQGKQNAGFGTISSQYNTVTGGAHVVFDSDVIDQWRAKDRPQR